MIIRWYYGIAVNFLRCGNGILATKENVLSR